MFIKAASLTLLLPVLAGFSQAAILPEKRLDNSTSCCGYVVTNRGDGYFKNQHIMDFSTLTSIDEVIKAGWKISHGYRAGGINRATGQQPWGNKTAVQIAPGQGMTLTVKGGQSPNASFFSVGEILMPWLTLGGVFEIEAKLTGVFGTTMGIFTYHAGPGQTKVNLGWEDEQDFEMMGETLFKGNKWNKPGMSVLNYEPKTGAKSGAFVPFPAGLDPTADFHTYSISWFPSTSSSNPGKLTEYWFDGELINTPPKYASVNPSNLIINHWTNASPMWSAGPPVEDAVLTIRKVTAYFDKPMAIAAGTDVIKDASCSKELACRVTV